ncbi:unnamed protein product [Lactuca saligna]|uniref:Alpha-L-arabinofuranosidase C-terminal domain-containing protein n=1 Tax=Lactuca saligna TaxID=75948 RepID=A0AA36EG63_LACSI|nr:unnamed protein product [Lactuca saligna]CAI9294939.1 unnamed protein product [Lactuca saligna]
MANTFDHTSCVGPKAFVSEYVVRGNDAGSGSLLGALVEAGFLIGVEKNSDVVEMASYAPLFVNTNDRRYWMQHFFKESNGATLLKSTLQSSSSISLEASAIVYRDTKDDKNYLRLKDYKKASEAKDAEVLSEAKKITGAPADTASPSNMQVAVGGGGVFLRQDVILPTKIKHKIRKLDPTLDMEDDEGDNYTHIPVRNNKFG